MFELTPQSSAELVRHVSPALPYAERPLHTTSRTAGNLAIQRRSRGTLVTANPDAGSVHDVLRGPGQPLDGATRGWMEERFNADFGEVRVHTDARADRSARALNASAYTVGRNIVFGRSQYAPTTNDGRKLIAHELTHVIQQGHRDSHLASGPLPIDNSGEPGAEHAVERISSGQTAGQVGSSHGPSIQRQVPWWVLEAPPVEPYIEPRIIPPEPPGIPGEGIPTPGEGIPSPGNGGGYSASSGRADLSAPRPGCSAQTRSMVRHTTRCLSARVD